MKQENFEHLSYQLKYIGFGEELLGDLKKNMEIGKDTFTLGTTINYTSFEKNVIQYDLNFKKGKEDIYFLNSYIAKLGNETAKIYVNKNEKNITSKEAFNLMEGRAVYRELTNKEGEKYHAWQKIDTEKSEGDNIRLKSYSDNYGYDLEAAMNQVVAKQLFYGLDKEKTIQSLQKGNLVSVMNMDKSEKFFVAADPQFKSMEVFKEDGAKISLNDLKNEQEQTEKQSTNMKM